VGADKTNLREYGGVVLQLTLCLYCSSSKRVAVHFVHSQLAELDVKPAMSECWCVGRN
jgi:hypothetical protein